MRGNFIRFQEDDPKAIMDKISAALTARKPPVKHIMVTKIIRDIEFAPKFYPNLFNIFDVKAANMHRQVEGAQRPPAGVGAKKHRQRRAAAHAAAASRPDARRRRWLVAVRPRGAPASAGGGGAGGPAPPHGINDMMI